MKTASDNNFNTKTGRGKRKAAIVGVGRFGKTLHRMLKDDFDLVLFDTNNHVTGTLKEVYECPTIFFCVPIPKFEKVLQAHRSHFKEHLLIDVLSVKMHAADMFKKYLKGTKARAMLTHPMFGPDSEKHGLAGLPIVVDQFTSTDREYAWWKKYFQSKKLAVIELSAAVHDKMAAYSQGMTHFVSRLLDEVGFKSTPIDTRGAKQLLAIQEQVGHNTWELFVGLQNYNPYAKKMREDFLRAFERVSMKLGKGMPHAKKVKGKKRR